MINATMESTSEYKMLSISGHAGYAEAGKDIVCAAVSMMFYTLAKSLRDEDITNQVDIIVKDDVKRVKCYQNRANEHDIGLLFWMACEGIETLSEQYPNHVTMSYK